jgi:hypothetical protein
MIKWLFVLLLTVGCAAQTRPFPLRAPMTQDTDLASVYVKCRREAAKTVCAPEAYESPLYWDGVDSIVFRPLSEALGVVTSGEAVNVNSLDEVPDSSWFTNRGPLSVDDVRLGGCTQQQMLDPDTAADGSWIVDRGKTEGSTGGFRVNVPGKGKYMLKVEDKDDHAERQAAASVIGAAVYHAVGFNTVCEQVLYIRPSILHLMPGLISKGNFSPDKPFNQRALDNMLAQSTHLGDRIRVSASAWLDGRIIGPFRYEGTRQDDPNDVVAHENRRELRGMRVLAAWLNRYDAREENSLDTWLADDARHPNSSPGHVVHYQLDLSEVLGGDWSALGFDQISRRLGTSYILDWSDFGLDLATLGIPSRPWDRVRTTPGRELFGYFDVKGFDPGQWKSEYPNPAFTRLTERDAAWMARILARFTPAMIKALVDAGRLSKPDDAKYLEGVLEGRLARILERYLLRLSPITRVHLDGDELCGTDLADQRHVRDAARFHYTARTQTGHALATRLLGDGEVCVTLSHDLGRYTIVRVDDGVATGPLIVHLYNLGNDGFQVVGLERPPR